MATINLFESTLSDQTIWLIKNRTANCQSQSSAELKKINENDQQSNLDELFAFGYACKLFRDDSTALKLDSDTHLIPWNGQANLLIDRCVWFLAM
jgi:hypothetical protein